jgi:hypothetical protein
MKRDVTFLPVLEGTKRFIFSIIARTLEILISTKYYADRGMG